MNANLLRHCANCSRWTGQIDLYCEPCWENIFSRQTPLMVSLLYSAPYPIFSLLRWEDETPIVGQLVRTLKGDWADHAWMRVALKFLARYLASFPIPSSDLIFVPAPRNEPSKKDHALLFAEALSRVFDRPIYTGLTRISGHPQKSKEKTERWKTQIGQGENEPLPEAKCYIFVDDLITTGATAQAVWKSLNSPLYFQVWTLACRPFRGLQPCSGSPTLL